VWSVRTDDDRFSRFCFDSDAGRRRCCAVAARGRAAFMAVDLRGGRDNWIDRWLRWPVSAFAEGRKTRVGALLSIETEARKGFDRSLRCDLSPGSLAPATAVSFQAIRSLVGSLSPEPGALYFGHRGWP